jgi:hypothetical protein
MMEGLRSFTELIASEGVCNIIFPHAHFQLLLKEESVQM